VARILVVDDNEILASMIGSGLEQQGYRCRVVHDGLSALEAVKAECPDLVVLDIVMPGMDGLEVCRWLRDNSRTYFGVPIIFLTARGTLEEKIEGFNVGADDYLAKPFEFAELAVRIRALLKRANFRPTTDEPRFLRVGDLVLDRQSYRVTAKDRTAVLTPVEFELLQFFMLHVGEILHSDDLLQAVWAYPPGVGNPALVRKHIEKLRMKLEQVPDQPHYIRTIVRRGYIFS
jgi:DNA-binding response OmpR family regulator